MFHHVACQGLGFVPNIFDILDLMKIPQNVGLHFYRLWISLYKYIFMSLYVGNPSVHKLTTDPPIFS